ncbi:hypothetical protein ACIBEA_39835 [Streptomyces sp. NPDC051555]|uniref:hypothetical protein n=1 Tax=Streptomyces sp. NPDC051555 TaxID=3365657 RepID=UPI0037BB55A9
MSSGWQQSISELRAQGDAARASGERAGSLAADGARGVRDTAIAVRYAAEADYLRSAQALLRSHLADRLPPRRLPAARIWPGFRDMWRDRVLHRRGGLWRAVPDNADLDQMRRASPGPRLEAVIEQAEALRASLHGHRQRDSLYESYIPDPAGSLAGDPLGGNGRSAPTLPGFPDPAHRLNRAFPQGTGFRIQPGRLDEFDQLWDDESAVHQRAVTFGDEVLALLVELRLNGVTPPAGRLRGAGRWIAREEALVAHRPKWPAKLTGFQIASLAGTCWLVLACTGLPLTFGHHAGLLSHYTWLFMAAALIACTGTGIILRYLPKLIQGHGPRAAAPGIAAALLALVVWQGQGPLAEHFFAGPYDRYEREYADGCLAVTPYRHNAVQAAVADGVLVINPTNGGPTLRLGPAENGGTHPLRPLDQATRTVLDEHGC